MVWDCVGADEVYRYLGTKTKQTVYCMVVYTLVNILGSIILITVKSNAKTRGGLLVAFYLMQCFQSLNPSVHTMLSRNVAGQTKKSIVYAMFCESLSCLPSLGMACALHLVALLFHTHTFSPSVWPRFLPSHPFLPNPRIPLSENARLPQKILSTH
jgi:hypothetical protein